MTTADASPARGLADRLLRPPVIVMYALLGSIAAKMLASKLFDPDLWWHLATGRLIVRTRGIPHADPFSYTANGREWVVQEWGSEVILHGIREAAGMYGILLYRAVLLVLIYVLVARLITRRIGTTMLAALLLTVTAYAGSPNWSERPNLLSFLLFVLTLTLLERRDHSIWWFVPMAVVWANLHGMVILGVCLIVVVAAAEGLKVVTRWPGADGGRARTLWLVAGAGLLAAFANPEGPGLIAHAFRLVGIVEGFVGEWQSPDFHSPGPMIFMGLLLLTIAAIAFNPQPKDPTDVALVLAFTVLGLHAARNLAVASIVIGVTCARWLPGALATVPRRPRAAREVQGASSTVLGLTGVVVATVGLAVVAFAGFPRANTVAAVVEETYPVTAIDSLRSPGVRVFSHDGWAGMVIERAWPQAHVYIDLRWDFYGPELSRRYGRIVDAHPRWNGYLDEACTTHVLVRPRDPITQVLTLSPDWAEVRRDKVSVIFARARVAPGCESHPIPRLRA